MSSKPHSAWLSNKHKWLLFATLLICYAYFFPRWADWNQNSRIDLVLALVDDHVVTIDKYVANTGDYAYVDGHYYSDKAPGMALLGVPVYAVFRMLLPSEVLARLETVASDSDALGTTLRKDGAGLEARRIWIFVVLTIVTFITVVVPSALLGVVLYGLARHLGCGYRQSLAGVALFGLGTSAFPYANSFVGHQTSAFLLFAAFGLVFGMRYRLIRGSWLPMVGFLLGYAAITEYPTVLIGVVLVCYAVLVSNRRAQALVGLIIGGISPLILLATHNYFAFGSPLQLGYSHSALWTDVHNVGFVSLTYPKIDALWGITFGAHRGLFFLSPYLLFALPGYRRLWQDGEARAEFWVLLLAPLSFLLFNASSAMWQGGFAVGPRYLIASLPFLGLVAALGLAEIWRGPVLRIVAVFCGAWSFFAVWSETIAGQSFPDYTANPLFDLSLPQLASGDIARNVGMLLGLAGWASVVPLVLILSFSIMLMTRRPARPSQVSAIDRPEKSTSELRGIA